MGLDISQILSDIMFKNKYKSVAGAEKQIFDQSSYTSILSNTEKTIQSILDTLSKGDSTNENLNGNRFVENSRSWYDEYIRGKYKNVAVRDIPVDVRLSSFAVLLRLNEENDFRSFADSKGIKQTDLFFAMESDAELIKEVSGVDFDESNEDEVNNALSRIYVDDKNLRGCTLKDAADKIKKAIDTYSESVVLRYDDNGKFVPIESPYVYSYTGRSMENVGNYDLLTSSKIIRDRKYDRDSNTAKNINQRGERAKKVNYFNKTGIAFLEKIAGNKLDSPEKLSRFMRSIYINGHSVTAVNNIKPNAENAERVADIVKNALSIESSDNVSIMTPNSIEPEPVPVLPMAVYRKDGTSSENEDEKLEEKRRAAIMFAAYVKNNIRKAVIESHKDYLEKLENEDEVIFGFLNSDEDVSRESVRNTKFNNNLYFRTLNRNGSRVSFVHGMMLEKGYTMEQIMSDTGEIRAEKRRLGQELYDMTCPSGEINSKENIDKFNRNKHLAENMYIRICDKYIEQKPVYIDLSDADSIKKNYSIDRSLGELGMDVTQSGSVSKSSVIRAESQGKMTAVYNANEVYRTVNNVRLSYMRSEEYTDINKEVDYNNIRAYVCQAVVDNIEDIDEFYSNPFYKADIKTMSDLSALAKKNDAPAITTEIRKDIAEGKLKNFGIGEEGVNTIKEACNKTRENINTSKGDMNKKIIASLNNRSNQMLSYDKTAGREIVDKNISESNKSAFEIKIDDLMRAENNELLSMLSFTAIGNESTADIYMSAAERIYKWDHGI